MSSNRHDEDEPSLHDGFLHIFSFPGVFKGEFKVQQFIREKLFQRTTRVVSFFPHFPG